MDKWRVYDPYTGRSIMMDEMDLHEIINCANIVREAKHKKMLTVNELLAMFGFPKQNLIIDPAIDRTYWISYMYHNEGDPYVELSYSIQF